MLPAGVAGEGGGRARPVRAAGQRGAVQLPQRHQGDGPRPPSPSTPAAPSPRSRSAPRPVPAAAVASRSLTAVMNDELAASGAVVDTGLCGCFPHTRAELYEIVRTLRLTTFAELLDSHGRPEARERRRLRDLQAHGRLDHRLPRARRRRRRLRPGRRAGRPPGHQRPLPRQPPAQRLVLDRAAHPRRGDHPGEADRDRRGGPRLRPLHQDHRRPADRPVRRPGRPAPGRSGPGWWTPASSPATRTARRCAP